MRILFLSDNFPPETNAPASRVYEHAKEWVKEEHEVVVVTCAPNYPEGKLFPGYRNKWLQCSWQDGIKIERVKTYMASNQGIIRRTIDHLSFMLMSFLRGIFLEKPDVIIGTSPQFFTAVAAWGLSVVRRVPFVFELRDLWPASIVAVGAMNNNLLLRWIEKLELFLYRKARAIIVVTHSFKDDLISRGVCKEKIYVICNGVDSSRFYPRKKSDELLEKYHLKDKWVVSYLGAHGMAHGLSTVLEAANLLRNEPNIHFLFVGSGAERATLMAQAEQNNLTNVTFALPVTKEKMPAMWGLSDLALIPLKNKDVFSAVIPSKLFEAMGMGIPILMSVPAGEATGIVQQYRCGEIVPPENPKKIASAIRKLYSQPHLHSQYGQAALRAANNFSRKTQAEAMLHILEMISGSNKERKKMKCAS